MNQFSHSFAHVPASVPSLAIEMSLNDEQKRYTGMTYTDNDQFVEQQSGGNGRMKNVAKASMMPSNSDEGTGILLSVNALPLGAQKKDTPQRSSKNPTYTKKRRATQKNVPPKTDGASDIVFNAPPCAEQTEDVVMKDIFADSSNQSQYVVQASSLLSDNNEMALLQQQMNRLLNENNEDFHNIVKGKRLRTKQPSGDASTANSTRRKKRPIARVEKPIFESTALRNVSTANADVESQSAQPHFLADDWLPQSDRGSYRSNTKPEKKIRYTSPHDDSQLTSPLQETNTAPAISQRSDMRRSFSQTRIPTTSTSASTNAVPKVASFDMLGTFKPKKKQNTVNMQTSLPGGAQESISIAFSALSLQIILYIKTDAVSSRRHSKENADSATPNVQVFVSLKNMARHLIELKIANLEKKQVELLNKVNGAFSTGLQAAKPSLTIPGADTKSSWKEFEFAPLEQRVIYIQQPSTTTKKQSSPKNIAYMALQELDQMLRLVAQGKEDPSSLIPVLFSSLRFKVKCIQSNRLSRYCQHLNAHSIMQKTSFTDKVFPPKNKSISSNDSGYETKWMRPRDLLRNQQASLFSTSDDTENVHISHIYQGKLGNCYLLSALGALTRHHPKLIHKLFTTKTFNRFGIYEMRICFCGEWKKVQVDDFLPVNDDANRAKYVHTHHSVIWPAILEKGYAKLYGTFLTLKRGKSENAMTDLTGMPSKRIEFRHIAKSVKSGQFFDKICSYSERKYPMCTSTIANIDKAKTGLGQGHAYTLLMARRYTDEESGQVYKLVCLRDPRGSITSKLPFNPRDKIWSDNPDLRFHFHCDSSHETEFWISYEDYIRYFNRMSVCFVRDWKEKRARILCMGRQTNSFLLTTHQPNTAIYIMLHQNDKRVKGSRDYVPVCAVFTNSVGTKYLFDTNFERKRTVRVERIVLEKPDTYAIIPLTTAQDNRNVILSIHSEQEFKLSSEKEKYSLSRSISIPRLMEQCLLMHGAPLRTKKIAGCTIQLWKKVLNRDVLYGFKLHKVGKKVSSVDIEYKVTLKNMDVVCGHEYGVVTLSPQNEFAFLIRFCANAKSTHYRILWTERGKLQDAEVKKAKPKKKSSASVPAKKSKTTSKCSGSGKKESRSKASATEESDS
eukprot:CAMPEP_0117436956 /NCGR_PEP_ID=MMETSP0759-20121206/1275_1 /TAXON_ID=63605 /ORGANISM="Percolomonas cosmopolitus, Strain WS" /LENGTH=1126 /DNA_ID=CAMNT_0005228573 /DNA_START=161 /DNA_END=3541 /DNA_ORIENTATION=-